MVEIQPTGERRLPSDGAREPPGRPAEDRTIGPPPSDALPDWARAAFPGGLYQEGSGVWAVADERWNLEELVRISEAATRRMGGGADIRLHFETLLRQARDVIASELPAAPLVLDLRSGDGVRSVLPWLDLLPEARVIACDPASMSLATLVGRANRDGYADRVIGVVADADDPVAAPGSVDVVSGVACLQEMPDPDRLIELAAGALRPGGHAIFLAPFDGHGILRVAYDRIRGEAACRPDDPLAPGLLAALSALSSDIAARTLPNTADPAFIQLQDKWLFSRESIEGAARRCGFSQARFLPHNDHETLYRDAALVQLRSFLGVSDLELPSWVMSVLDSFDSSLRPPVKRLLMLEATIVLTR
jgi:SAM-dependent methyltransferase